MFHIRGLDPQQFRHLFTLSERELALRGAVRRVVDEDPGYPCRVSLDDARVGEEVLLLQFEHHATSSPYRQAGPIYVRRSAEHAFSGIDVVPPAVGRRLLSVRAYDRAGMMRDADVTPGEDLAGLIERFFADGSIDYLHVHNAKPGCFACRVDRA